MTCPRIDEIDRALADGPDAPLRAHLAECVVCTREWKDLRSIVALGRSLPFGEPSRASVEEMRTVVLASFVRATPQPTRGRAWVLVGISAVAAALALVVLSSVGRDVEETRAKPRRNGTVTAIGPVELAEMSVAPDEVVRVRDGIAHVEVTPLAAGDRFRVVAGDGEVEVRGTAFDVEVRADHLVRVVVRHGRVAVRARGAREIVLGAGDEWRAPVPVMSLPAPVLVPVPAPAPAPIRAPAHHALRSSVPSSTAVPTAAQRAEQAFREGWDALRTGDASIAAASFERAVATDPRGAVAEDAAYWHAIALLRARRHDEARRALAAFVDGYPVSARTGEASVRLGWELLDAGGSTTRRRDSARRWPIRCRACRRARTPASTKWLDEDDDEGIGGNMRYASMALTAALAACGGSKNNAPDAAPTVDGSPTAPDAVPASNAITGTVNGKPFNTTVTVLRIGKPDDLSTTVVYVFDGTVRCDEIVARGWDTRVTNGTQDLEIKMLGKTVRTYQVPPGEASINYTLTSTSGTPTESLGSAGQAALTATVTDGSRAQGTFDVTFAGNAGHLSGSFDATYCASGMEP